MNLGRNWKIEADTLNIILYQRHISKKKGELWKIVGYYSTAQNALKDLVLHEVRGTGLKDFETIVKKIDEVFTLIEQLQGLPTTKLSQPATTLPTMGKKAHQSRKQYQSIEEG